MGANVFCLFVQLDASDQCCMATILDFCAGLHRIRTQCTTGGFICAFVHWNYGIQILSVESKLATRVQNLYYYGWTVFVSADLSYPRLHVRYFFVFLCFGE